MPRLAPEQWASALHFDALETQHGLTPGLLSAVVTAESNGDPNIENPRSGARGLFQHMPNIAKSYKIDPTDPMQAAPAAAEELGSLSRKYQGDLPQILAAWNWGQGRLDQFGMAKAPQETKGFIQKVTGLLSPQSAEAAEGPRAPYGVDMGDFDKFMQQQPRGVSDPLPPPLNPPGGTVGPGTQAKPESARPMPGQPTPTPTATSAPPGGTVGPGSQADPSAAARPAFEGVDTQTPTPGSAPPGGAVGPGTQAGPASGFSMDTQVIPNQDPSQPALLAPSGAAVGQGTGGYQMTIDIAKPSEGNVPGSPGQAQQAQQAQFGPSAASVKLTPGMTGEQVARSYGYDPSQFTAEQLAYLPRAATEDNPLLFGADPGSFTGRTLHGFWSNVHGGMQLIDRGLQKAGIVPQGEVAYSDLLAKIDATRYAQVAKPETHEYPIIGDPAKLVGDVAFGAMIPGVGAPGKGLIGLGRSAATGAAFGAIQPITDTSTTPGAPGDPFAAQKLKQTATGAIAGTAVEYGVARPLMWGVNKAFNATRGVFANPEDKIILDLSAAHGVDPSYADVRGKAQAPAAYRREVNLERRQGAGAGEFRQQQQVQAKTAAKSFQDHYVSDIAEHGYASMPGAQTLAATGDRQAARAVAAAQQAGSDPGLIMKASADLNLQALRGRAKQLYDRVEQLAQPLGDVPPQRTLAQLYAVIDDIDKQPVHIDPSGTVRKQLVSILDAIEPKTTAPDTFGRTTTTTPRTSYAMMAKIRSDLGTLINEPHMRDTNGARILSAVREEIEKDLQDFAIKSGVPELAQAKLAADTFYPQVVRQRDMVRDMEHVRPDELNDFMFKARKGDRATDWFSGLDEKGKAAARAEIITQALYDGPNPAIQPSTGVFSPAQFAGNLERLRAVTDVTFPKGGEVKWQLDGFVNLMRHLERAGQYVEFPPTGMRAEGSIKVIPALIAALGGGVAGGHISGVAGAMIGNVAAPLALMAEEAARGRLAKVMLMNPAGRNFLLAASNLQPGSPKMQALVNEVAARLPALAGQVAGQASAPAPAPPARRGQRRR